MEIINVIEIINGVLSSVDSFVILDGTSEDPIARQEIVDAAESLFKGKAIENGATEEDMDFYLDTGSFDDKYGYEVLITWSNVIL